MKLSKNVENKMCAPKKIFFKKKKNVLENFEEFLTKKFDFEIQSFALFDKSTLHHFTKYNNLLMGY